MQKSAKSRNKASLRSFGYVAELAEYAAAGTIKFYQVRIKQPFGPAV